MQFDQNFITIIQTIRQAFFVRKPLDLMSKTQRNNEMNSSKKPNKNIEINMSTLSIAQKQMCIKLLAQNDINFEQAKDQNCFEAELRIDPSKIPSNLSQQKQSSPNISPIKTKEPEAKRTIQQKQNISRVINNKQKQQKITQKPKTSKPAVHPIYINSKKSLGKTVKLNNLNYMENIHPFVQLYVYPKKMSFQTLIEFIEQIYDFYWNVEINGNRKRQARQNLTSNTLQNKPKSKAGQVKTKGKNLNTDHQKQVDIKEDKNNAFCLWVYNNFISVQKEKIKVQQILVNFIESLNHFSFKHIGIQIFHNFLSGVFNTDTLNYYLVIRALLEQVEGEKIIEKVSSYGSKAGVLYRMKLNPYDRIIQEQKVYNFLQVCCQSQKPIKQDETVSLIFQQMTQRMFFDEKKKKNFIHFFQMTEILLKEFLKVETVTVNTTNLELSLTQQNSSMNDFFLQSQLQFLAPQGSQQNGEEMELTFEVQQTQNEIHYSMAEEDDLEEYLPKSRTQLQNPPTQKEQKSTFEQLLIPQIYKKYENIRGSLSNITPKPTQNQMSLKILQSLIQAVVKCDKTKWIDLIKIKKGDSQRQSRELLFIEKMQRQFENIKDSNIVSNQFIRKLLTASYLREAIVKEAQINFKQF